MHSDAPTSTGGSVWKGREGGNGGGRGLSLHVYNALSPPPPLACPSKILCQTKSGKMYKIMKLVAGEGTGGGGDNRLNEEGLEISNHRDGRGLT